MSFPSFAPLLTDDRVLRFKMTCRAGPGSAEVWKPLATGDDHTMRVFLECWEMAMGAHKFINHDFVEYHTKPAEWTIDYKGKTMARLWVPDNADPHVLTLAIEDGTWSNTELERLLEGFCRAMDDLTGVTEEQSKVSRAKLNHAKDDQKRVRYIGAVSATTWDMFTEEA